MLFGGEPNLFNYILTIYTFPKLHSKRPHCVFMLLLYAFFWYALFIYVLLDDLLIKILQFAYIKPRTKVWIYAFMWICKICAKEKKKFESRSGPFAGKVANVASDLANKWDAPRVFVLMRSRWQTNEQSQILNRAQCRLVLGNQRTQIDMMLS